jgi:prephenate dehydrogenase
MTPGGFPRSITIYGTGLIGSSIGLALKKHVPEIRIHGVDSPEVLKRAQQLGAIDSVETIPADLLILAAPVGVILQLLGDVPADSPAVLDVGSTKVEICGKAASRGLRFVGGHPMTGSERSGPEAASPDLFRDAPFFLCPVASATQDAISTVTKVVEAIGANVVRTTAEEHDRVVARLSHLPQIVSTLLADQASTDHALAGPGWKSVTRLAASPFHVWRDILETSGSLPAELQLFADRLRSVLEALENGDMNRIETMFQRANRSVSEASQKTEP